MEQQTGDLRFRHYQTAVTNETKTSDSNGWGSMLGCLSSSYSAALIAALIVFIILITIRPSFVMAEPTSAFEEGQLSWWRAIVWSAIAAIIVLLIRPCRNFFKGSQDIQTLQKSNTTPAVREASSFNPGEFKNYGSF